ncbi:MAG TPA: hypothetical protein VIZ21_04875 [Ignavibacteriaceae bacterium]|jgi:hypothetical protein
MTYEKTKVGVLIGFISVIVALLVLMLFVPISTIFLALVLGLLFALPVSALVLVLISGASIVSKKMRKLSKSEKIPVVISTSS